MFVPLLIRYGITFVLGTVVGKLLFGREDAIALVYAIQIQASAWYNKFVNRCFGEPEFSKSPILAPERA